MDCLVPGIGEIIGGSQREDSLRAFWQQRMDELGLEQRGLRLLSGSEKIRLTQVMPDFGLGFERCVMYLTGMGNIRDVIPFPRTVKNCEL